MTIRHQTVIGADGGVDRGGWLRFVTASQRHDTLCTSIHRGRYTINALVFMRRYEARSPSNSRGRAEDE
jgi:hypothetical protein